MNMHCASRLGWIRSSKEASPHAPEEVTDPAQAGSAASGRASGGARASAPTRIRRRKPRAGAAFCLLAAALLLALPATVGAQVRGALVLSAASVTIADEDIDDTATYTVRLNTQPASKVTVVVATGDEDIALFGTGDTTTTSVTLTFGTDNWDDTQVVTVRGVNDAVDNPGGSRVVEITNTPSGAGYGTGDAKTVQAWVENDGDAVGWGFVVLAGDLNTAQVVNQVEIGDEDGGTVAYRVVLNSEPTSDVTVAIESDDPSTATVSPTSLLFSPDATKSNAWSAAQTITVTGVNDNVDNPPVGGGNDGRLARIIHTPNGGGYDYIEPYSIEVTVLDEDGGDDEVAVTEDLVGLTLTPSTTGNDDEPLKVDDEDGGRATYTVRLNTMPTATVTVFAESEDSGVATVSPLLMTFTRANWDNPQTVTVTGLNDDEDNPDDMRAVRITHASSGGDYDTVDFVNENDTPSRMVNVSVLDDDTAGLRLSSDFVRLDENGTKTYTVRLETKPTADVTVTVASTAPGVATVLPTTLTFTTANPTADNYWNKPQRVTVSAVADDVDNPKNDRTTEITHTTSGDAKYNDSTEPELLVTVEDDADTAALVISESAITVTEVTEATAGNTGTYTVKLNSAPPDREVVTVTLVLSGDTGLIEVTPTSLQFTGRQSPTDDNGDWDVPKPVTVTATSDNVDTPGDARVTIKHSVSSVSGEGGYNDVDPIDVQVTVKDDDVSELEVPRSLSVSEDGGPGSYTVWLLSDPGDGTVSVTMTPSGDTDAIGALTDSNQIVVTSLSFTGGETGNWSQPQRVNVTGVGDGIDNPGNARSVIIIHTIPLRQYTR